MRFEGKAGLPEERVDEVGPALDVPEPVRIIASNWSRVAAAWLPRPIFIADQAPSTALRSAQGDEQIDLCWVLFLAGVHSVLTGEITESASVAAILKVQLLGTPGRS